ncbi:MAG: restriction endonuclease subunit S [Phycisphaerales bacterium]|nr:restriction endonuclease subunit S [Phycisphaerales bacterium]
MFQTAPELWARTTLGEIVKRGGGSIQTGPFGSQLHASDYVPVGVPSIMPVNIGDNRLIRDGIACITEADARRLSKHIVRKGDIIYSRRGDVERRSLVRDPEDGWFCGTGCLKVRLGDGVIEPEFASYYLGHPEVRAWIVRHSVGITMPNLNTSIMQAIPFLLPPLPEQRAIAGVLGSLDDKIEQNRRTASALERLARAIFRAWFVDFGPVKAKAAGATVFPSMPQPVFDALPTTFTDSEIGPVPEGWELGTFGSIGEVTIGGHWGEDSGSEGLVEVPCLRGVDLGHLRDRGRGEPPRRWFKPTALDRRRMDERDVLIGGSGAGPTGRPLWMCPALLEHWNAITYSNFCKRIRCASVAHAVYLDAWLHEMRLSKEIWDHVNGTSVPNLNADSLMNSKVIAIPPEDLVLRFHQLIGPMWNFRFSGESRKLAEMRDYLLPKLLSGKVRVNDAARVVEEVA